MQLNKQAIDVVAVFTMLVHNEEINNAQGNSEFVHTDVTARDDPYGHASARLQ